MKTKIKLEQLELTSFITKEGEKNVRGGRSTNTKGCESVMCSDSGNFA